MLVSIMQHGPGQHVKDPLTGELLIVRPTIVFRVGRRLLDRFTTAAYAEGLSLAEWMRRAMLYRIEHGLRPATKMYPSELTAERIPYQVPVDPLLYEIVEEQAALDGNGKTAWVLDAMVAALGAG